MAPVSGLNDALLSGRVRRNACTSPRRSVPSHRSSSDTDSLRSRSGPESPVRVPAGGFDDVAGFFARAASSNNRRAENAENSSLRLMETFLAMIREQLSESRPLPAPDRKPIQENDCCPDT